MQALKLLNSLKENLCCLLWADLSYLSLCLRLGFKKKKGVRLSWSSQHSLLAQTESSDKHSSVAHSIPQIRDKAVTDKKTLCSKMPATIFAQCDTQSKQRLGYQGVGLH